MKLIRDLEEMIEDEIHDIEKYAKFASEVKNEYPSLAQALLHRTTMQQPFGSLVKLRLRTFLSRTMVALISSIRLLSRFMT